MIKFIGWLNTTQAQNITSGKVSKLDFELTTHRWWPDMVKFAHADDMNNTRTDIEQYVGKRVFVTDVDGELMAGVCRSIGINAYLKRNQIVINRTPLVMDNFNRVCSYFKSE